MDDKWFIFFDDGWLNFHRSWTGYCIYRVRIEPIGNNWRAAETWVNRDPSQNPNVNDEFDIGSIRFLVETVLLHKSYDRAELKNLLQQWHKASS